MRSYKKRTKSTRAKTYADYLAFREEAAKKGYMLKDVMSKQQFENYYSRLREAKRRGEIKSQPWAELKRRERFVHWNNVQNLAKAATNMLGTKVTTQDIYHMDRDEVKKIGEYLNATKYTGLYGGDYE